MNNEKRCERIGIYDGVQCPEQATHYHIDGTLVFCARHACEKCQIVTNTTLVGLLKR